MGKFTANINTQIAVNTLANCLAEIFVDSGEDIDGEWIEKIKFIDSVSGNFQKSPKLNMVRGEDGSEFVEGVARLSLVRAPKQTPRYVRVNGELWKVVKNLTRETRLQHKYLLEYQADEPAIIID